MPIYTDKRNGRLFVQFNYKGQTTKRYLPPGATRRDAARYETKLRNDLFFQAVGMRPRNEILFEDFLTETFLPYVDNNHSEQNKYRADLLMFAALPFFRGKYLRHIKASDIEEFKNYRKNLPTPHGNVRAPATIWREISILSKFFSLAVDNDAVEYNPCARVKLPTFDNRQTKVLPYENDERFFAAFQSDQSRDIARLVLNTGLRQNDALSLSTFHLKGDTLELTQGKTKRVVILPLNNEAFEIIYKYKPESGLIFPSPQTGKQMLSIRTAIASACRRAEIEPVTIRDLRRTFATRLADQGEDELTIAMLLGHSDLRTVHKYAHSMTAMRKAVEKIGKDAHILPERKLRAVT